MIESPSITTRHGLPVLSASIVRGMPFVQLPSGWKSSGARAATAAYVASQYAAASSHVAVSTLTFETSSEHLSPFFSFMDHGFWKKSSKESTSSHAYKTRS